MIRALLIVATASLACQRSAVEPDAGGGVRDAATTEDGASPIDASATCSGPGDCPCFSNYDCPETHACTSLDDTGEQVWCLEGPRGSGVAGDLCETEADCATALCVEGNDGNFYCSDRCQTSPECPDELPRCLFIGFGVDEMICAPL